jgi:hypothetical protein
VSTRKIIRTRQYGSVYSPFVELFSPHLFKKKSKFYDFLKPKYMRNKKVFKTFLLCRDTTLSHRLLISSMGKPSESVNRKGGCGIGERGDDK